MLSETEQAELEKWIEIIWEKAHEMGLDPYPTHFEIVPDHVIYELGSYGLPARFSHWTFGRDYHRQKTSYEYGMSQDLRDRLQHQSHAGVPARHQLHAEPQAGGCPRVRPFRFLPPQQPTSATPTAR